MDAFVYRAYVMGEKKQWVPSPRVFATEQACKDHLVKLFGDTLQYIEWKIEKEPIVLPENPTRKREGEAL